MTRLLARLVRVVLLWLLGRRPATRARRALAWTAAVVACALALEAGVLGACLTVAWWLLAQLAALLIAAGAPLVAFVAVLAVARRALRRVIPAMALREPPASDTESAGSSDTVARRAAALQPASGDTRVVEPTPPSDAAPVVSGTVADAVAPDPAVDEATPPEPAVAATPPVEDPLAAEAAWLEAHWAAEPQPNGSSPPAGAPAST